MGKTFSEIDREMGIPPLPMTTDDDWPLPTWYRSLADVPISQLTASDLARACRHQIHADAVVPCAVEKLKIDPTASDFFDYELLLSLGDVDVSFWETHREFARDIQSILKANVSDIPNNFKPEVLKLSDNLNSVIGKFLKL